MGACLNYLKFARGVVGQVDSIVLESLGKSLPERAIRLFLFKYFKMMCDKIVVWMLCEMMPLKPATNPKQICRTLQPSVSKTVYYMIGSGVKTDERRKSSTPRLNTQVFKSGAEAVPDSISGFAKKQNRAGLILSNCQYYDYAETLVLLLGGQVYYRIITYEGTSLDSIFDFLCSQDEVIAGWVKIIGSEVNISSEESIHAFHDYTKKIINTFMAGVLNQIRNVQTRDIISQALRSNLAASSKTLGPA